MNSFLHRIKIYFTGLYFALWSGIGILLLSLLVLAVLRGENLLTYYAITIGLVLAYFTRAASFDEDSIKEIRRKSLKPTPASSRYNIAYWVLAYAAAVMPYFAFKSGEIHLSSPMMLAVIAALYVILYCLRPQILLRQLGYTNT